MQLHKAFRALALKLQEQSTQALTQSNIAQQLNDALSDKYKNSYSYCYTVDVIGDDKAGFLIYMCDGDLYKASYTLSMDGDKRSTVLGEPVDVLPRTVYDEESPSTEAAKEKEIVGDVIALKEGAVGQDGTALLKLIAPGWGSSGYYSSEVLKRDGPTIFKKGTKNFWNHQTAAEEAARPEGDLRDLASVLTEDARWDENGPAGAGLYAKANVFEQYRQPVDSLAKHIGVSIRAMGKAREGKAEGKSGPIVEQLTRGISADYVTTPGAGGQILQLFEAARGPRAIPLQEQQESNVITPEELKKLQETQTQLATENRKLHERMALTDARDMAKSELSGVRLPDATKNRLIERLVGMAPLKDGDLDKPAFKIVIEAEVKDEAVYLAKITESGRVVGMGAPAPVQLTEAQLQEADAKRKKDTLQTFRNLGMNEAAAKAAAEREEAA